MKIVLSSAAVRNRDIEFNTQAMIDCMAKVGSDADLIVFGESVLQGFDCLTWDYKTDKDIAVAISDPAIRNLQVAAKKYHVAVCFGFIERCEDALYSSQIFIGSNGEIINLFHRVSVGWKEYYKTDEHYREGERFEKFCYGGKSFTIGLCGDLWTDGRPEEMKNLDTDVVLWPVWCDYAVEEWNNTIKHEYAEQAALCGKCVLLVNPYCADADAVDAASGGAVYFENGKIFAELPAGTIGHMIVEL